MNLILVSLLSVLVVLSVTSFIVEQQVYALSKFFNCMTEIANSNHALTETDVNNCFHKEFHH